MKNHWLGRVLIAMLLTLSTASVRAQERPLSPNPAWPWRDGPVLKLSRRFRLLPLSARSLSSCESRGYSVFQVAELLLARNVPMVVTTGLSR